MLLILFGWMAIEAHQTWRQHQAVAAIEAKGGEAVCQRTARPEWLRKHLGSEWFRHVVKATFDPAATDEDLEHLNGLAQLEWLRLDRTQITDAGLKHLRGLTRLQKFGAARNADYGRRIGSPGGLAQLQTLDLNGTAISDAGLECLKRLDRLRRLSLRGTKITDAGLKHLKGLPRLETLWLDNTKVTTAGLEQLDGLRT